MRAVLFILPLFFLIASCYSSEKSQDELFTLLCKSIAENDVDQFRESVKLFREFERTDSDGDSLINACVSLNRASILEVLLSHSRSVELRNGIEMTPLQTAASFGYIEIIRLLLDAGASVDALDSHRPSNTALTYACRNGQYEAAKMLLKHNANVNWLCEDGMTPLTIAKHVGHSELEMLLRRYGATR